MWVGFLLNLNVPFLNLTSKCWCVLHSQKTGVEKISHHVPGTHILRWNATWCKDEISRRGKCDDGFREGRGRYYLEGPLELLDTANEWSYASGSLSWLPPAGSEPSSFQVRSKNQTYAFEFLDSTHVALANLTFFATTIRAYDDVAVASTVAGSVSGHKLASRLFNLQFESLEVRLARRIFPCANARACLLAWRDFYSLEYNVRFRFTKIVRVYMHVRVASFCIQPLPNACLATCRPPTPP